MKLDRTLIIALGLAVASALLSFRLTVGSGHSSASQTPVPSTSAREHACVSVVAEHAACTLPPRHALERGALNP